MFRLYFPPCPSFSHRKVFLVKVSCVYKTSWQLRLGIPLESMICLFSACASSAQAPLGALCGAFAGEALQRRARRLAESSVLPVLLCTGVQRPGGWVCVAEHSEIYG